MRVSHDDYDRLYKENPKDFWALHACRKGIPQPLQDAFHYLGTTWSGMDCVLDYVAQPMPSTANEAKHPPALIISGRRDFAYRASNDVVWKPLLDHGVEAFEFIDGAHYIFYEEPEKFGQLLEDYMERKEN